MGEVPGGLDIWGGDGWGDRSCPQAPVAPICCFVPGF